MVPDGKGEYQTMQSIKESHGMVYNTETASYRAKLPKGGATRGWIPPTVLLLLPSAIKFSKTAVDCWHFQKPALQYLKPN